MFYSKETRKEMYQTMLKAIENTGSRMLTNGLCYLWACLFRENDNPNLYDDMEEEFPELYAQKPKYLYNNAYWSPFGDWEERKQALLNAIKLLDNALQ